MALEEEAQRGKHVGVFPGGPVTTTMPQVAHGRRCAIGFHAGFCYVVQPTGHTPQCSYIVSHSHVNNLHMCTLIHVLHAVIEVHHPVPVAVCDLGEGMLKKRSVA